MEMGVNALVRLVIELARKAALGKKKQNKEEGKWRCIKQNRTVGARKQLD